MECKEALPCMHEYLDGTLEASQLIELRFHLKSCRDCSAKFRQLERTEALVRAMPAPEMPADLTGRIMSRIPRPDAKLSWLRWPRRHPAAAAAAVFLLVMVTAFVFSLNQSSQMVVSGNGLEDVEIHGNTVVVPKGHTVRGNLTVEHGNIDVEGKVSGNLVVVDGKYSLASTAYVSGQITSINQTLDWIWYRINHFLTSFSG